MLARFAHLYCLAALIIVGGGYATDSFGASFDVVGHVTQIEPSYVPASLAFAIDVAAGACPAGPWLIFTGTTASNNLPDNVKAIYAGLVAAMQSGTLVEVYGTDSACAITNVHFLNRG